jgi:hypothetical protein
MNQFNLPLGEEPYFTQYMEFIQSRPLILYETGKTHKHHILPKSLKGDNKKNNLIIITIGDHYDAHYLLWKCYGGKMSIAFHLMTTLQNKNKLTKEEYALLQKQTSNNRKGNKNALGFNHSKELKKRYSEERKGNKNPMYKKNAFDFMSNETEKEWKKKQSESKKGKVPSHGFTPAIRNKLSMGRKNKPNVQRVLCIETGIIYKSIVEASISTKASKGSIGKVCKGQRQTAGKLHWEYA